MDGDFCAVCADSLEWVAYGACGHKDVCTTCVARLRFICDDSRCCICKSQSDVVFVTKALGDYTHTVSDFSAFPPQPKEGRVGSYWYHEDTQAFFDDVDHYKMVKAMCKLSCSICDKAEGQLPHDGPRRRTRFRNIEQLKGHMFHQHKLVMCSLCLNGRKIFICEQKLYTKTQLKQHMNTGDSEVDGTETERGGFMGHPKCEFCRTPFYGDNELYTHMSTEHYTCHICQRQHPGQYEYYKDYDDLEIHFGKDHYLCEDEGCLAKKFIVFASESELKRHNAMEHAGRMSRSERIAALTLPTSFRYRRDNEQERNRGRGRSFQRDTSHNQLSDAIQACIDSSIADGTRLPDLPSFSRSSAPVPVEISEDDPLITPFEPPANTDAELAARYREAVSLSRNAPLAQSAFPPLPVAPPSSLVQSVQDGNSMAARLRRQNKVNVVNSSRSSSTGTMARRPPVLRTVPPQPALPTSSNMPGLVSTSGQMRLTANNVQMPSSISNPVQVNPPVTSNAWPTLNGSTSKPASQNGPAASSGPSKPASQNGPAASSYSSSLLVRSSQARVSHSASVPNLVNKGSFEASSTDFPPVSANTQAQKLRPVSNVAAPVEDRQTANSSLVEQMRAALDFDEDKFSAFKDVSSEYRVGTIDAETYLCYVEQFGLSHLVFELARLCPDVQKQRELFVAYNVNLVGNDQRENGNSLNSKNAKGSSKKGKEKVDATGRGTTSKDQLADSILSRVGELQSSYKATENETEVLSKDGYRTSKGKSKVVVADQAEPPSSDKSTNSKNQSELVAAGGSTQKAGESNGKNKQRKKTSKFHRVRLGDGSAAALLDLRNSNSEPEPDPDSKEAPAPAEGLPARGVWRAGGAKNLFTT